MLIRAFACLCILGASACGGGDRLPYDPERLGRADNAFCRGDAHRAREILAEILLESPRDFAARYRLGAFLVDDDPDSALAELAKAAALRPRHPGPRIFSGFAGNAVSDFPGANRELAAGCALARGRIGYSLPDTTETIRRGLEALAAGRSGEAMSAFHLALQEGGNEAALWYLYAEAAMRAGAEQEASEGCGRALERRPRFPDALVLRARIEMHTAGDGAASARRILEEVLTLVPGFAPAHYQLGFLELADANHRAAARHFLAATLEDPSRPEYHYELGQTLFKMSLPVDGARCLDHFGQMNTYLGRLLKRPGFARPD